MTGFCFLVALCPHGQLFILFNLVTNNKPRSRSAQFKHGQGHALRSNCGSVGGTVEISAETPAWHLNMLIGTNQPQFRFYSCRNRVVLKQSSQQLTQSSAVVKEYTLVTFALIIGHSTTCTIAFKPVYAPLHLQDVVIAGMRVGYAL